VLLLVVAVTAAGGLGLLVGGARPRESLHFIYAVVLGAAIPIASSLARGRSPRVQGIATVLGAAVALVVIARLFGTG
jgi:hypothetical protein